MTVTATAVSTWASDVQSALSALPQELEQAAPTGSFANVLAQATVLLREGPGAAVGTKAGTATAGGTGVAGSIKATMLGPYMSLTSPMAAVTSNPGAATTGERVVAAAAKYIGTPYVWGGNSPSGFDCSGLVQYVYGQLGIHLPRTSEEQALVGTAVPSLTQAVPGDLLFFAGSDGTPTAPGHVGIYIGDGKMIDAPYTGTDVQVQTVGVASQVVAIRRIVPDTMPPTTATANVATYGSSLPAGASAAPTSTGPVAVPASLAPLFVAASAKYGISATLLTAVARQESGFTPKAVSSAGAEGMMQIMPGTAASLGVTPFTPRQAVDGAAALLSGYIHQYGSIPLALAAYSAGPGAVAEYGGIPPYAQTQSYVSEIMRTIGGAQ